MKRIVGWLIAITLLLVPVLAAVLWLQDQTPVHAFVLSNGSTIVFEGATFGTNHVTPSSSGWQRFVPQIFARWVKNVPRRSEHATQAPSVILWFSRPWVAGMGPRYTCSLVHADGTESALGPAPGFITSSATNIIEGLSGAFPWREKKVRVRFYEEINYGDMTVLGEFPLRNPKVRRVPRRPAPPLPQSTDAGDLNVTLASLEGGARSRWGRPKTNFMDQWTKAGFRVRQGGVLNGNWTVQRMEATDMTGNLFVSHSRKGQAENGLEMFECQPSLWPSEAYRLRFEFSRKAEAGFDANELWTIHDVAVPADGQFTEVDTQKDLSGFTVRFHSLTSPQAQQSGGTHTLAFSISPVPTNQRFTLVRVTDETGAKVESFGSGSGNSEGNWFIPLRFKQPARKIDLTVALHRSRFVEFTARPSEATNRWTAK